MPSLLLRRSMHGLSQMLLCGSCVNEVLLGLLGKIGSPQEQGYFTLCYAWNMAKWSGSNDYSQM